MPRRNSENGPSGRTRIFNLTLAIIFCVLIALSAASVIRRVLARKPVGEDISGNDILVAQFEMRDADGAEDGDSEEEDIARKVSGSIVFVSDGDRRSIGAVISDDGYIVTDVDGAVSVEDMDGRVYEVRRFDADLPEGLYLIRIDSGSEKAIALADSKPEDGVSVYVFSAVTQGFIVKSCAAEEDGDYLVLDAALPDGLSIIVDEDGKLVDIGLAEDTETGTRIRNNLSKLQLFAAAAENRE